MNNCTSSWQDFPFLWYFYSKKNYFIEFSKNKINFQKHFSKGRPKLGKDFSNKSISESDLNLRPKNPRISWSKIYPALYYILSVWFLFLLTLLTLDVSSILSRLTDSKQYSSRWIKFHKSLLSFQSELFVFSPFLFDYKC